LQRVGFSAAPSNATAAVLAQVDYVATRPFGEGLLEIVTLVERRNREHSLTNR
jgi:3-deoxy-D-manno-octulosonate 8-phosphate phosphatase KdsC-like HAD superfamily phosphatase